jgi:hypothetical protein
VVHQGADGGDEIGAGGGGTQDGAGQSVLSAYVEIVFDNSDNRLPVRTPSAVYYSVLSMVTGY